jgi:curli biogenesis system outer membrane secretion channel CsgG
MSLHYPLQAAAQLAAPVRRVAVVCETTDPQTQQEIMRFQSRAGGALLKTGRFALVDRTRLDKIIREQGFSNSGYADPHTAARLGKLAGAEQFLNVNLTEKMEADRGAFMVTVACRVSADFTLVDVSTGRIMSEGSADGDAQDKMASGVGNVSSIALENLRRTAVDLCIDDLIQQLTA